MKISSLEDYEKNVGTTHARIQVQSGTAPERNRIGARLCAKHSRSDRDSTWKNFVASGVFQQAGFAKLLRLVPHEAGHSRAPGAVPRMRPFNPQDWE
jgi:hypothetical protein